MTMDAVRFLSDEDVESIHFASLEILDKTGIDVMNEEVRESLETEGCIIDSNRVRFPVDIVETSLKKIPSSFSLSDRDGNQQMKVGGDNVIFNPGSSTSFILDSESGEIRKSNTQDLVNFVRLVDGLSHIAAQSTAMIPTDVPNEISDFYRLFIVLSNSTKPIISGAFSKQGLLDMVNMLEVIAGGAELLSKNPRAIFDCCPLSPLMWGDISSQNLVDCAKHKVPAQIVPAPMMGGTSAITLSGTLAQANAEILSGIVISQTAKPGAPLIYGGAIGSLDMVHGTYRIGSIEATMAACASAEIARYYGMPSHAYLGISDSHALDNQSGVETSMGIFLAALSKINIISGPGMLSSINCQSLEKIAIDNEICASAYRLLKGISVDVGSNLTKLVEDVGPGGNFLVKKHTSKHLREEHFVPTNVISRLPVELWKRSGSKNSPERAREVVKQTLETHTPHPLSSDLEDELGQSLRRSLEKHGIAFKNLPIKK
ncbi:MAG: trimethylamine methyltransferase family protein [Candidatus Hodarchaeota archaeon]